MYESWLSDFEEQNEFARSYAILQGSFANPEMAQKMIKSENPVFESSEEDFERTTQEMLEKNRKSIKKRHRRVLLNGDS
jgi:Glu-tRNA(Gln) amidotransferase subunit E-like FAD-binding protein